MSYMTDAFQFFEDEIYVIKELKIKRIFYIFRQEVVGVDQFLLIFSKNPVLLMQVFYLFKRHLPLGINFDKLNLFLQRKF